MDHLGIKHIAFYLPEQTVSNAEILADYKKWGGTQYSTEEELLKYCGVSQRHAVYEKDTSLDLGQRAAEKLFSEYNYDRKQIDYIIFVSDALEYKGPTTACVLQERLKLKKNCAAIDILHGCTGWTYGISLAESVIKSGLATEVLLVTADIPSRVIHPRDAEVRAIFSDGGAATVIGHKTNSSGYCFQVGDFVFGTDGKGRKNLMVERSGTDDPADLEWHKKHQEVPSGLKGGRIKMNSPQIFLFAYRIVPKLIQQTLEKNKVAERDIDFYVLHQANAVMLEFIRKKLKIDKARFIINLQDKGNTVSATVPIALREMLDDGKIKKGQKLLIITFGIGYSWGGTVLTVE